MKNTELRSQVMKVTVISALSVALTNSLTGCEPTEVKELRELMDAGAYSEAVSYYKSNQERLADKELDEIVNTSADNIYNNYLEETLSANDSLGQLDSIKAIGSDASDTYIDSRMDLINSDVAFKAGQEYMNNKSYFNALDSFKSVIEDDPNYIAAQSNIKETEQLLKEEIISKADTYIYDNDFSGAIAYLEGYLEEFTDRKEIEEKIDSCKDAMLDDLLPNVNDSIEKGDYYNALVGIEELEKDYSDSKKLQELRSSTETSYLEIVIPLIDDYIKNNDYVNAYSVCVNAMEVIKDSKELQNRYDKIEPHKPVLLSEIKISESEYFEQLTDHTVSYEDVIGNSYAPGNLYRLHLEDDGWGNKEQGYAKVYMNSQYKTLTGTLALDDISDKGDCIVTILVDDENVYQEKFNRSSEEKNISLDITGKQWLQIMISFPEKDSDSDSSNSSNYYTSEVLVSNFAFLKS